MRWLDIFGMIQYILVLGGNARFKILGQSYIKAKIGHILCIVISDLVSFSLTLHVAYFLNAT